MESEKEVEMVKTEPLKYLVQKTFPRDIRSKPSVFIIGKSHTGKTGLCKLIEKKLGLVRIKPSQILEQFLEEHFYPHSEQAQEYLRCGRTVPDELMAQLLRKRTSCADCIENGWVLDGYPKTRQQAEFLANNGMIPMAVFTLQLSSDKVK